MLDGEENDVPAGSLVFLRDPKVKRYARAEEPGTTVLAVGGKPGSHEVSAWEYFFTAYGVVDQDPSEPSPSSRRGSQRSPITRRCYYHLACIYARTGRLDEARTALDRALELDPELQKWADEDEDLAPIRELVRHASGAGRRGLRLGRTASLRTTAATAARTIAAPRTMRQLSVSSRTTTPSAIATTGFT